MTTAEKLVKVLTEKKMTCATAESCTGGGSAEKPVGLVWFGLASGGSCSRETVITEKKVFPGDRDAVRAVAIEHALNLLLNAVTT